VYRDLTKLESFHSLIPSFSCLARLANKLKRVLEKRNSVHIRSAHEETVRKRQMTKAARAIDRLRESSKTPGWSGAERSESGGMLDGSRNLLLCCRNEVQHLGRDGRGLSRKERLRQGSTLKMCLGRGERVRLAKCLFAKNSQHFLEKPWLT